ncbi:uncharacterized protein [Branchiostoma lanceolatum]|uniref:uncharacterized protein isoform X1 n=1 Tax=Branchiostoma lanceolatum TaxID=7740 RepID=UPI0034545BB1
MAKIILLLVAAVTVLSGFIEGKPTKCRSILRRSNPGPGGYAVLTQEQVDIIAPLLLNLKTPGRHHNKRLNKRTDAPFRMFRDCSPDRIPRDISVARCRRKTCNNGSWVTGYTYAPKLVIWKATVDGELQYRAQYEQVPVACVCMTPRTARPG